MKIGIIGAMDEEIQEYLNLIKDLKRLRWNIFIFYKGLFNNHELLSENYQISFKHFNNIYTCFKIDGDCEISPVRV